MSGSPAGTLGQCQHAAVLRVGCRVSPCCLERCRYSIDRECDPRLQAEQIEQALLFQQAERLSMRQDTRAVRDIIAGNIDLLCSPAPIPKPRKTQTSVSALIEASLAVGGNKSSQP